MGTPSGNESRAEVRQDYLRVWWAGEYADFHPKWLRHQCDLDRHALTRERTVCSSEIPDDIGIASAHVSDGQLRVVWSHDARESRYALAWLFEHAYAKNRVAAPPPSSSLDGLVLERMGRPLHAAAKEALALVERDGVAILRADPQGAAPENDTETLIDAFAALKLAVRGTHFGRIEDLRTDNTTNQNTDQLGYTDAPVNLHTDQPFIDEPPRYQLLHCIRPASQGGENAIVDARAAAAYLADTDLEAYRLLTTVPVYFHRKQAAFESLFVGPILDFGPNGEFRIRYSYFTMAPFQRPFAEMEAWYRAYDRFARLVRDPRHQRRHRLARGEALIYDNARMLHARTGFAGARWLRGVYFDRRRP